MAKHRKNKRTWLVKPEDLDDFIVGRKDKKHRSKKRSQNRTPHRRKSPGFSPEPDGTYTVVSKGGTREVNMVHGRIVNQLVQRFKAHDIACLNTQVFDEIRPDIVIPKPTQVVIEIKGGKRWADIYCAIGQLIVYSQKLDPSGSAVKVVVVPRRTERRKVDVLKACGIIVVKWRRKASGFSFTNLKRVLASLDLEATHA